MSENLRLELTHQRARLNQHRRRKEKGDSLSWSTGAWVFGIMAVLSAFIELIGMLVFGAIAIGMFLYGRSVEKNADQWQEEEDAIRASIARLGVDFSYKTFGMDDLLEPDFAIGENDSIAETEFSPVDASGTVDRTRYAYLERDECWDSEGNPIYSRRDPPKK